MERFYVRKFRVYEGAPHRCDGTYYVCGGRWNNYLHKNGTESGSAMAASFLMMASSKKQILESEDTAYYATVEDAVATIKKHGHLAVVDVPESCQ